MNTRDNHQDVEAALTSAASPDKEGPSLLEALRHYTAELNLSHLRMERVQQEIDQLSQQIREALRRLTEA